MHTALRLRTADSIVLDGDNPNGLAAKGYAWTARIAPDDGINLRIGPGASTATITFDAHAIDADSVQVGDVVFTFGSDGLVIGATASDSAVNLLAKLVAAGFNATDADDGPVITIKTDNPALRIVELVDSGSHMAVVDFTVDVPVTAADAFVSEMSAGLFSIAADEAILVMNAPGATATAVSVTEVGLVKS